MGHAPKVLPLSPGYPALQSRYSCAWYASEDTSRVLWLTKLPALCCQTMPCREVALHARLCDSPVSRTISKTWSGLWVFSPTPPAPPLVCRLMPCRFLLDRTSRPVWTDSRILLLHQDPIFKEHWRGRCLCVPCGGPISRLIPFSQNRFPSPGLEPVKRLSPPASFDSGPDSPPDYLASIPQGMIADRVKAGRPMRSRRDHHPALPRRRSHFKDQPSSFLLSSTITSALSFCFTSASLVVMALSKTSLTALLTR